MAKSNSKKNKAPVKKILGKIPIPPSKIESKKPTVSVILSSYNHAAYIAAAIQSVLDQTFTDFELLIYDDGSTDNTHDVVKTFDDPRIKTFLYTENRGPRLATQEGFAAAQGKYIAIHHSDDTWSADKLKKQVEFLDAHEEYAACFTLAEFIDEDGNLQTLDEGDFYATIFDKENRSRAEWLNYFFYNGNCLCHPSLLIRRDAYTKYSLYDVQGLWQLPDYFMWVNLCFHANFYIMHEKLVQFRLRLKHRDNMSASTFNKRVRGETEMYFVLESVVKNFRDDKFFLEVFPAAEKFVVDGKINRQFAFAQICLENSDTPFSGTFQLIALNLLKKLLSNDKQAAEVKALYNYDEKAFLRDTGNTDVFNLAQKLSLPHGYLYFDTGNDFNADERVDKYIFVEPSGNFYVKYVFTSANPIQLIRFDPDENFISLKLDAFTVNGKDYYVTYTNANEIVDGFYRFLTNDPQFVFYVDENLSGNVTVEVRGKIDLDYAKTLNAAIAQIQSSNVALQTKTAELENENSDLSNQNQHLQNVNKNLAEYNSTLKKNVKNLSEQVSELENVNTIISRYNDELENANQILLDESNELEKQIATRNSQLAEREDQLTEYERQLDACEEKITALLAQNHELEKLAQTLLNSTSWKVTAPLRGMGSLVRKVFSGDKPNDEGGEVDNGDVNLKLKAYRIFTNPKFKKFVRTAENVVEEKMPTVHEKIFLPTKAAAKSALLKFSASKAKTSDGVKLWKLSKSKFTGLVSVIVPNYNHAQYLRQRLETIYNQTYKNFEVILLDDASTDDSRDILNEFYELHKENTRMIFNTENSGGAFIQWQRGIDAAKGSLIWIAESDDYSAENFLESLVDAFTDDAIQLAFARSDFMQDGVKTFSTDEYLADIKAFDWTKNFAVTAAELVECGFGVKNIIPNVSSAVFRKPTCIRDKVREMWKDMKLCGDWLFYLDIIKGGCVYYTAAATNFYRVHKKSTSLKIQKEPRYYEEHQRLAEFVAENYHVTPSVHEKHFAQLEEHFFSYYGGTDIEELKKYFDVNKILSVRRKPNILMCVFALSIGGGETFPLILANEYSRIGYPVTVIDFQMSEELPDIRKKLHGDVPLLRLGKTDGLAEVVYEFKIDVIHSHHGSVDEAVSYVAEKNPALHHVVTLHGMYEATAEVHLVNLLNRVKNSVDAFIYIAEKNLKPFTEHDWTPNEIFHKIGNGLELSKINPIPRSELNIPQDAFVCCTVSRAIPEKGWQSAIDAVTLANRNSSRRIDLVLVGSGEMYDKLKGHVPEFVHLTGFKSNVRDYLATADIGLLPSEFLGESFPLMIIDSFFSGRPVVCSDLGESAEMLKTKNGESAGIVFSLDKNDKVPVEQLAEILTELANDEDAYKKISARVPDAAKKFYIESVAEKYLEVYYGSMDR
ncbi:MAG: glycosyltransferase [Selenomonadaceae bacterium]|nr:glycosyltransferase [Selenomonadaceae bacterium]